MQLLALLLVTAAGLWIVAVATLMDLRPADRLRLMTTTKENLERSTGGSSSLNRD
jgi:hypothetical protein